MWQYILCAVQMHYMITQNSHIFVYTLNVCIPCTNASAERNMLKLQSSTQRFEALVLKLSMLLSSIKINIIQHIQSKVCSVIRPWPHLNAYMSQQAVLPEPQKVLRHCRYCVANFRCLPHCPLGHLSLHIKCYGRVQLLTTGFTDISQFSRNWPKVFRNMNKRAGLRYC